MVLSLESLSMLVYPKYLSQESQKLYLTSGTNLLRNGVGAYVSRNGPDEIPRPDVRFTVVSKALVIFQRLTLFRV